MYIDNKGLNGFWGDLWSGFKSVFTGDTRDDAQSSTGGKIGRRIGGFLSRLSYSLLDGIFKGAEYVPTPQELLILNPLKTALNNYMITLVKDIDTFFNSNSNTSARMEYMNNAIRKVQIIQTYFLLNNQPGLSVNAQQFLSDEIIKMINSFELTIEELLEENGIDYVKTEGDLAVNPADKYPVGISINSASYGYGFQYRVSDPESAVISVDVPTSANNTTVAVVPNQATVVTEEVAGLQSQSTKNSSFVFPALLVLFAIGVAMMPSEKNEKEK